MNFRVRLLLSIIGVIIPVIAFTVLIVDRAAGNDIVDQFRAKTLSIAVTTAAIVDGELLRTIRTPEDRDSPSYHELVAQLRKIRDANRRDDTWVKYISTIFRDEKEKTLLRYGVDAEESDADRSLPGDVVHRLRGRILNPEVAEVDQEVSVDQWGEWLSANAPVRDSRGEVVGAILVEIPFQRVRDKIGSLWTAALLAVAIGAALGAVTVFILAHRVTRPLQAIEQACRSIENGNYQVELPTVSRDEFGSVSKAIVQMAAGLREREAVKTAFARYVSNDILQSIVSKGESPKVEGTRKRVTVLFCDIRGFTTLSERMRPEDVVRLLNSYFERAVDIIFSHKGMLDKFIGDGMMVLFGAPVDDPYQEEHALNAALAIQRAVSELRDEFKAAGLPDIKVGIGIHSGNAIVGNIGSSQRLEYTAIGDTVNFASRLESATKEHGVEILLSEFTAQALTGNTALKKVGSIHLKGKEHEVTAFTVDASSAANP